MAQALQQIAARQSPTKVQNPRGHSIPTTPMSQGRRNSMCSTPMSQSSSLSPQRMGVGTPSASSRSVSKDGSQSPQRKRRDKKVSIRKPSDSRFHKDNSA